MIYSMTGFGKTTFLIDGKAYAVEIRALNSKQLDLNVRIPSFLREKEMEIRSLLGKSLKRGKIEINISTEKKDDGNAHIINQSVAQNYRKQIGELNKGFALDQKDYLDSILKLPNVLQAEETELNENIWEIIVQGIEIAVKNLNNFRIQEGEALQKDLLLRVHNIKNISAEVEKIAPERIEKIRSRINESLNKIKDKVELNQDRFEQEILFYLEKLDLNEELVRLSNHCAYFEEMVAEKVTLKGKKLGFIAQEIGREINTVGSKANHSAIQKWVVQMKDELEKIKEQSFNVL